MTELVRMKRVIDLAGADAVMSTAEKQAAEQGAAVVIAVVDDAGILLNLRRADGAQVASANVAIDKARTAAIFGRPTRVFEEQISGGRIGALALHGAAALTGGIPLQVDGEVVGAVGTSGVTPDEDERVSIAGAQASFSTVEVPTLTYEGARVAAEAVAGEAGRRGIAPVVAVTDPAGRPLFVWRPDRGMTAGVDVSIDKARTAATFRRPSKDFEDQANSGRPSALHLAGGVPLRGGAPILRNGRVVGGIGVSAASAPDEDHELALLGAQAVADTVSM